MQLLLKRQWEVLDASSGKAQLAFVGPGIFEVERIPNPCGYEAYWLVLKGTKIGATEGFWRDWQGSVWNEFEILVKE